MNNHLGIYPYCLLYIKYKTSDHNIKFQVDTGLLIIIHEYIGIIVNHSKALIGPFTFLEEGYQSNFKDVIRNRCILKFSTTQFMRSETGS